MAAWLKNDLALKDSEEGWSSAKHLMRRRDDSQLVFGADTPAACRQLQMDWKRSSMDIGMKIR